MKVNLLRLFKRVIFEAKFQAQVMIEEIIVIVDNLP